MLFFFNSSSIETWHPNHLTNISLSLPPFFLSTSNCFFHYPFIPLYHSNFSCSISHFYHISNPPLHLFLFGWRERMKTTSKIMNKRGLNFAPLDMEIYEEEGNRPYCPFTSDPLNFHSYISPTPSLSIPVNNFLLYISTCPLILFFLPLFLSLSPPYLSHFPCEKKEIGVT